MEEQDFSTELRTRTRRQHDLSTSIVNLSAPLAFSSPKVYRMLLASWYWIYKTIEAEMEQCRRRYPKVSAIYFRELLRTEAFEHDLRYYYGDHFEKAIGPPSKATAQYITEFKKCVRDDPISLIAYCQTMYLAMFGGGQIVKRWIATAFAPPPGKGVKVFDFSDTIDDISSFRKRYDDAVNRIALTREEKDRIIDVKKNIFASNDTIFAEIRASRTYNLRVLIVLITICFTFILVTLFARFLLNADFRQSVTGKAHALLNFF